MKEFLFKPVFFQEPGYTLNSNQREISKGTTKSPIKVLINNLEQSSAKKEESPINKSPINMQISAIISKPKSKKVKTNAKKYNTIGKRVLVSAALN